MPVMTTCHRGHDRTDPANIVTWRDKKTGYEIRACRGCRNHNDAKAHAVRSAVRAALRADALAANAKRGQLQSEEQARRPKPDAVIAAVAEAYDLTIPVLLGKRRDQEIVVPRQLTMFLLRDRCRLNLNHIGRLTDRDHATVIWGIEKIARLLETDRELQGYRDEILETLTVPTPQPTPIRQYLPGTRLVAGEPVKVLQYLIPQERARVQFRGPPPRGFLRETVVNWSAIQVAQ